MLVSVARLCSSSAHSSTSVAPSTHPKRKESVCYIHSIYPHLHYSSLFSYVQVCFNMGQITLAKKLARQALRLLKRNFPWTWFGVLFQTFLEKYWHSCSLNQRPDNPNEK